jgi:hypothetical protein
VREEETLKQIRMNKRGTGRLSFIVLSRKAHKFYCNLFNEQLSNENINETSSHRQKRVTKNIFIISRKMRNQTKSFPILSSHNYMVLIRRDKKVIFPTDFIAL